MKAKAVKGPKEKFRKRDLLGWLVMLPSLVLFAFFVWEPLLENIRLSFCTAKMYTITGFAGLDNYSKVIHDVDFMAAFKNTFAYTFWSLIIGFVVPIILGVLISETVHCKSLFVWAFISPISCRHWQPSGYGVTFSSPERPVY